MTRHLCPFHYFGVPDEVDYTNIPWRNAQFDVNELTAAIATEARASNALEQFRKLGGKRCIAFCCSQRHADFMAHFFVREGVPAVAVHSGQGSAPRATSLERLRDGELQIVFAVDMFNEGVDVPTIDTVLMLRPTESIIIWLQQLGRGLRIAPDKEHLTVIDYIGNHRAFLTKLRALALVADHNAESVGRQREVLAAIVNGCLVLPPGCEVTYELAALNILKDLLRPTRSEDLLEAFYHEFQDRHGTRPTAIETFHAGLNPRANSDRSWLGFIDRMNGFEGAEATTWKEHQTFFERLESTPTVRSYKLALLLAMLDGDAIHPRLSIDEITSRVADLVRRVHRLAEDFSVDPSDVAALRSLLVRNPIEAFVKGDGMGGASYFAFDGSEFAVGFDIEDRASFGRLLREVLDWRLGQYLARGASDWSGDLVCRVALNAGGNPILFLPTSPGSPTLPQGALQVAVDGQSMEAVVAKIAINVMRRPGEVSNLLPDVLRAWFGTGVGTPGRGDRVRLRRLPDGAVMEPIGTRDGQTTGLKLWDRYLREVIPGAFGLTFSRAIWNVGFVVSEPHLFLLVSLEKIGANPDHQYVDHFVSDREFSWQSQNRTTPQSKHGQMIRDHQTKGLHVHLLVRPGRRGPFLYCGEIDFVSWEGSAPIAVLWPINTVGGKRYSSESAEGRSLWERLTTRLVQRSGFGFAEPKPMFGDPILVRPRLGQGAFRVGVIEAYDRRCVVTGERTLPALEAAHILPVKNDGQHEISNGLLLRRDLHGLFDQHYVTITPDRTLVVSKRIKEEFENGKEYYAMHGRRIRDPKFSTDAPSAEALRRHNELFVE